MVFGHLILPHTHRTGRENEMNVYSFKVSYNRQVFWVSDVFHDTAEKAFNAVLETLPGAELLAVVSA